MKRLRGETCVDTRNNIRPAKRRSCFLWDETNGWKGSVEIGTCLLNYISKIISPEVEHVVLYADTCAGQNLNQNIMACLLFAINRPLPKESKLRIIDVKFLESGHICMEADSIHVTIEKVRKHKKVYTPNEYALLIKMSRKKSPYDVYQLKFYDFYDLEKLTETIIENRNLLEGGKKLNWLHVKWFHFERKFLPRVGFKYDVGSEFQFIDVKRIPIDWEKISLSKKYERPHDISLQKKKDLKKLLREGVIPKEYSNFYENLPADEKKKDEVLWMTEENIDDDLE